MDFINTKAVPVWKHANYTCFINSTTARDL